MNRSSSSEHGEQLAGLVSIRVPSSSTAEESGGVVWTIEPGYSGSLQIDRDTGHASLVSAGSPITAPVEGSTDAALLQSVAQLVRRSGFRVSFTVKSRDAAWTYVDLSLFLPSSLWLQGLPQSSAAAGVFRALQVPSQHNSCGDGRSLPGAEAVRQREQGGEDQPGGDDDRFSLDAVFRELPSSVLPSLPPMQHGASASCRGACLGDIPEEALRAVLTNICSLRDLAAVRVTCKALHHLSGDVVPGLKLKLFPHQRAAVQWMRSREAPPAVLPHPSIKPFVTDSGFQWFGCLVSGSASTAAPPEIRDIRGGLFCDEPGLGKTITALSLILSTLGRLPEPPPGIALRAPAGPGQQPFYLVPELANASEQSPALSTRRSSRRLSGRLSLGAPQSPLLLPATPRSASHLPAAEAPGRSSNHRGSPSAAPDALQPLADPFPCRLFGEEAAPSDEQPPAAAEGNGVATLAASEARDPGPQDAPNQHGGVKGASEPSEPPVGWVFAGALSGRPENTAHFRRFLESHQDLVRDKDSALWWLSRLTVSGLATYLNQPLGLKVPSEQSAISDVPYVAAFRSMGFTEATKLDAEDNEVDDNTPLASFMAPAGAPRPQADTALDEEKPRKKRRRTSSSAAAKSTQRQQQHNADHPAWFAPCGRSASASGPALALDTPALAAALRTSPFMKRVFLSSATLIVVPTMLIRHWQEQIESHVEMGRLRVAIYSSGNSDAESMARDNDVVLTTFTKLSGEYQTATCRRLSGKGRDAAGVVSLLQQIHWQRIILDEGHMLGQSLCMTSKLAMAMSLLAGSRWVMTGTPTPSTPTKAHISHLHPLLAFLHEEQFGQSKQAWEASVQKPMLQRDEAGRAKLMGLLRRIMMRASKEDLLKLPPCSRHAITLNFAAEHAASYNQLTETIRRNFLLSDWNDEDHVENLLNPVNRKWAQEMLANVRKSCCIAGNLNLEVKEEDLQETLDLLSQRLGLPSPQPFSHGALLPWVEPEHPLAVIENGMRHGAPCQICGAALRMPIVTPCAHLLCVDCLQPSPSSCPVAGCGRGFQMQAVDDPARINNNPNPKWEVPHELIEWQPSYAQHGAEGLSGGEWQANWQVTKSTKCVYMLQRLQDLGVIPPRAAEQRNQDGNHHGHQQEHQPLPPLSGSPQEGAAEETRAAPSDKGLPSRKAIIFSQFWMHILLAARHLQARGVAFCLLKGGMKPHEKDEAVNMFQKDPDTRVLLMDESGSVGLDLSFVSYVLLLEPIADLSMEEQVISRAHRMGAKEPVRVETLMMAGTAEEEMLWLQHPEHHHDDVLPSGHGAAAAAAAAAARTSSSSSGLHHQSRWAAAWGGAAQQTTMDGIVAGTVTLTTDARKSSRSSRGATSAAAAAAAMSSAGPAGPGRDSGLYGDGSSAATEAAASGTAAGSSVIAATDTADGSLNEDEDEEMRLGSSSSSQLLVGSRGGINDSSSYREAARRDSSQQQQQRPGTDLKALGSTLLKHLHAVSVRDLPKINGTM